LKRILYNKKRMYIYVLRLESDKYYIGTTDNPSSNLYFNANESVWICKYKPIEVIETVPNCDYLDEDKMTIHYMKEKGIDNVRGGSFRKPKLSHANIITIKQMISSSEGKCHVCGKIDHRADRCPIVCFRCHREGHYIDECSSRTYGDGGLIRDSDEDDEFDCMSECCRCIRALFCG